VRLVLHLWQRWTTSLVGMIELTIGEPQAYSSEQQIRNRKWLFRTRSASLLDRRTFPN